jgi:mycothiol synthase
MVAIEWLETQEVAAFEDVAALLSECEREVIPDEPDLPAAEVMAGILAVPAHRRVSFAVAQDAGRAIGAAQVAVEDIAGSLELGEVEVFAVRADQRRRGVGRKLLDAVCAQAGRRRLRGYAPVGHTGGMGFAAAVGATPGIIDRQNRLRVADLDPAVLESWVKRASERAHGYSLVSFDGPCPDELLEQFARLTHVMNTAPRSPGDEDVLPTAEEVLAGQEARQPRMGWAWTVCARHDATGDLIGYTALMATRARPWLGVQWDTGVEPAHRNLGLGRWLKAANALRLLDERPEVTTVETWNAGVNAAMLSINDAMGFQPVAEWREWTLEVPGGVA